jgi:hypothetical protein
LKPEPRRERRKIGYAAVSGIEVLAQQLQARRKRASPPAMLSWVRQPTDGYGESSPPQCPSRHSSAIAKLFGAYFCDFHQFIDSHLHRARLLAGIV